MMQASELIKNLQDQSDEFQAGVFGNLQEDTTPEVALKILAKFLVNLSEAQTQIKQSLAEGTSELAWRACHKLAGSAELIGFVQFATDNRNMSRSLQMSFELGIHATQLHSILLRTQQIEKSILNSFPNYKDYL